MVADRKFIARPDVVDCDIGGDRALLHLETNTYFTMNATASALWLSLSEPKTLGELVGVVTERFEVTEAQCRGDIETLLEQMAEAQVIDVLPAEAA